jgi:hypothetical protein
VEYILIVVIIIILFRCFLKKDIGVEGEKEKGNPFRRRTGNSSSSQVECRRGKKFSPIPMHFICVGFIFPWTDNRVLVLLRRQSDPLIRVDVFPVFKLNLILYPPPPGTSPEFLSASRHFVHFCTFLLSTEKNPLLSLVSSTLRVSLCPVSQREERRKRILGQSFQPQKAPVN